MTIALVILMLCIFAMLVLIFIGKNLPEKLMSTSCMTNYIIVLLCLLSLFEGRDSFIDIAYIYALFAFAANLSIMKLGEKKDE